MALFDEILAEEETFKKPTLGRAGFLFDRSGNLSGGGRAVTAGISMLGGIIGGNKGAEFGNTFNRALLSGVRNNKFGNADDAILNNFDQGMGEVEAQGQAIGAFASLHDKARDAAKKVLTTASGVPVGSGEAGSSTMPMFNFQGGQLSNLNAVFPGIKPPSFINDPLSKLKFNELGNFNFTRPQMFREGGLLQDIQKIQDAGGFMDKGYVDYINKSAQIKPKIENPANIDFDNISTDISWVKKKADSVDIEHLSSPVKKYLNTLPDSLRQSVLITSGNDFDGHAEGSSHYKDMAVDMRWNPNLYNYILNDAIAKRMGISTVNPNHGTAKHIHLQYKNLKYGGLLLKDGMKLYQDGDKSEDIAMFDKVTGHMIGQMRYGERIFDQKATKTIELLAKKGDDKKLGEFVKKELATHDDVVENFVKGGPVRPKPTAQKAKELGSAIDRFFGLAPGSSLNNDFNFNNLNLQPFANAMFNIPPTTQLGTGIPEISNIFRTPQLGPNAGNGLPNVSGGGNASGAGSGTNVPANSSEVKTVQKTINDFIRSNAQFTRDATGKIIDNPNFRNGKLYGNDGKEIPLGLVKEDGRLGPQTEQGIALFNQNPSGRKINYSIKDGKVSFDNIDKGNFLGDVKSLANQKFTSGFSPLAINPGSQENGTNTGQNIGNVFGSMKGTFGNLSNGIQAAIATYNAANTEIPEYNLPPEYQELQRDLYSRRNQGFTPSEVGAFNDMNAQSRMAGFGEIKSTVGSGGTAGAVLGAIGNLDRNQRNSNNAFISANNQVRSQNYGRYANMVMSDQQRDYGQDFLPRYEQAVANRNAYMGAAQANLQNIEQRNQYNSTYGPGSPYSRYLDATANRENLSSQLLTKAINEPLFNPLTPQGNPYNTSDRDLRSFNLLTGK